eukprot:TRINITY_DN467_c0_g1_i1.p2 TRINITY_DN467_c0_g1~~TRINITY_DN467_c0_g1_i1.p2  ORF type:complete len:323 (+),score=55.12 TRINITY_DN467_c0_g1_i1:1298-2266(+)
MKAILVETYGTLNYKTDLPIPTPSTNQVLIKVIAAGVNPVYTYIANGTNGYQHPLPLIPGRDMAGVIERVGDGVKSVKVGDRVWGTVQTGAYAQFAVAEEESVNVLPESVSFEEGAALYTPYGTAFFGILHFKEIVEGDVVLVHGASGGVGMAAVQILRGFENVTVIGTAGTEEGLELIRQNGAHFAFNHRQEGYMQEIMEATGNKGVNLILEMVANVNLEEDSKILARYGKVVVIGSRGPIEINPRNLMGRRASIEGLAFALATPEELSEIKSAMQEQLQEGLIKPVIARTYPLSETAQAHNDIINPPSGATGKITINPWE